MNRRVFIKGLACVSLIAVSGKAARAMAVSESELDRVARLAKGGVVRDKVFVFDGPLVLSGLPSAKFERCTFYARPSGDEPYLVADNCGEIHMDKCLFEVRGIT